MAWIRHTLAILYRHSTKFRIFFSCLPQHLIAQTFYATTPQSYRLLSLSNCPRPHTNYPHKTSQEKAARSIKTILWQAHRDTQVTTINDSGAYQRHTCPLPLPPPLARPGPLSTGIRGQPRCSVVNWQR